MAYNISQTPPPAPTESWTCKFCNFVVPGGESHPCEYSSGDYGDGFYIDYCGNQECPMCLNCQGNDATPERIEAGQATRAIKEGRWSPNGFKYA